MTVRRVLPPTALVLLVVVPVLVAPVGAQNEFTTTEPVHVTALAVALTRQGSVVGASADISVSVATGGSGHVFIDTRPLAGTDMQGSARIAARVASALTGLPLEEHDLFFVVRSDSPIIAGPSAGGIMALAAVVALQNAHLGPGEEPWAVNPDVMATGTIGPDGTIGPVGGILTKAEAAANDGASLFLVPEGQGRYVPLEQQAGLFPAQGEPVDVAEHCREELSITCQEVGTLEELVELSTGFRIGPPPSDDVPTTAAYNETLGPLSAQLLEQAQAYRYVWGALNASSIELGAREPVVASLTQALDFARDARRHWEDNEYYSAASRAFSASIHSTHARLVLDVAEHGHSLDVARAHVKEAGRAVAAAERAAGAGEVTGMHTLYSVGAAQERVSDAESHLEDASAQLNRTQVNLNAALFDAAWAIERAKTVHWWLNLSEPFGPGPELPVPEAQLADEFIDLADETLAYAGSVLGFEAGPPRAAEQLARAKADEARGFHAAAILEAAESQVLAALSIEVAAGELTQEKVNTSRTKAAQAIGQARSQGVEPVLAVAMFEFAGAQEDRATALEFYRTARVYAGFSQVLGGTGAEGEANEPRFVGGFDEATVLGLPHGAYWPVALGWLAIGVVVTTLVFVIGVAVFGGRE